MIVLIAIVFVLVAVAIWAGKGPVNSIQAPDHAFGSGSHTEYGPLTDQEWTAHNDEVRRLNADGRDR